MSSKYFLIPDLHRLRRDAAAAQGLERVNLQRLYACLEPDPKRSPRDVYDLHWVMVHLLDGQAESAAKAKRAVWEEAMLGGPASRPGHHWADPNFFRMHFWISAAMAAHLAVAVDWLAAAGVLSEAEVAAIGDHFVSGFWDHIYPHMKGRGRAPIYVEPMNQDSAMVAGCLVIGHLFGSKWGDDARARRMYADALVMAGNLLGQFFPTGFDNDGFTYMRVIQPAVLTLIALVAEEVEGVDFYNERFAPNGFSVALFMEKLQDFTLPSGLSFPHGRYGYIKEWSLYPQAYAARKTGRAHYLERALAADQDKFIHPWIAMDLPLAVALAPYGNMPGTPRAPLPPEYRSWHDPAIWSNLASPARRVHAQLCWRGGAHGTFILERDGERAVLMAGEGPQDRNGCHFPGVRPRAGIGRDFEHHRLPWMQMSSIRLDEQWDPAVMGEYLKSLMVMENGVVLALDRWRATRPVEARYRLATAKPIAGGYMESEAGARRVQVLSSAGDWEALPKPGRRPDPMAFQQSPAQEAQRGFMAVLFNFGDAPVEDFRSGPASLAWRVGKARYEMCLRLDAAGSLDAGPLGRTDARLLMDVDGGLALFGARRWGSAAGRFWSTCPVSLSHVGGDLCVERLEYGHYLRYGNTGVDIAVLAGNGYDIHYRSGRPLRLALPGLRPGGFAQANGALIPTRPDGDLVWIDLPASAGRAVAFPAGDAPKGELFSALDALLRGHALEHLDPARRLLSHPDTYVRLAAAEVLGWLGSEADAGLLADALLRESTLTSEVGGLDAPWRGKWAFFSAITIMADALRKLGEPAVLPKLREARQLQVEPHAVDSIENAIAVLEGG